MDLIASVFLLQAMKTAGREPFPVIYVDGKEEGKVGGNPENRAWPYILLTVSNRS